jgi:ZIP family zinc transporter
MSNVTVDSDDYNWDDPNIPWALGFSIGSGLATGLGGSVIFFQHLLDRVPQSTILAVSLAISGGVMLYVSFIEIFAKSHEKISETDGLSEGGALAITTACFFAGMLFCVLLELLVDYLMKRAGGSHEDVCAAHAKVPVQGAAQDGHKHGDHDAELHTDTRLAAASNSVAIEIVNDDGSPNKSAAGAPPAGMDGDLIGNAAEAGTLSTMGMMTAAAIAIHNFPEGLATFLGTLEDKAMGASLSIAIAVHNIPEGLCVAMPIYYATGSKRKAFLWSLMSGVTEPIGGILGFAALQPVFTPLVFGVIFSMVGGMMVFIVMHELLPASHKYMNDKNKVSLWTFVGMVVMAISLVLFVM